MCLNTYKIQIYFRQPPIKIKIITREIIKNMLNNLTKNQIIMKILRLKSNNTKNSHIINKIKIDINFNIKI